MGTPQGLLLNELQCSPAATLDLILKMLHSIQDFREASVHSSDATLILFLIEMAVDVESYVVYAIDDATKSATTTTDPKAETSAPDTVVQDSIKSAEASQLVQTLRQYREKLREFLHGLAHTILISWLKEAEKQEDIETSAMVHAYLALLWTSLKPNELNPTNVQALLSSIAYVRNWHGFGLGQNRGDILWESDASFDPGMTNE